MPGPKTSKDAGYFDVSDWGEKDVEGAYPPGTMTDLGDGEEFDLSKLPDVIGDGGGDAAPEAPEKPAAAKPSGRAPGADAPVRKPPPK